MEKVMKVWSQISSFVIILSAIIGIIYAFYINSTDGIFILSPLIAIPLIIIYLIIFYIPLFYFAWSKNPRSKSMRIWSKIITILLLVSIVIGVLQKQELISLVYGLLSILSLVPLFYYGWRN